MFPPLGGGVWGWVGEYLVLSAAPNLNWGQSLSPRSLLHMVFVVAKSRSVGEATALNVGKGWVGKGSEELDRKVDSRYTFFGGGLAKFNSLGCCQWGFCFCKMLSFLPASTMSPPLVGPPGMGIPPPLFPSFSHPDFSKQKGTVNSRDLN